MNDDFDEDEREELPTYTNPECVQFVEDMMQGGLAVEHYFGRFMWEGPAVRVDDIHEAGRYTSVRLQHDNMGLGYIVYPVARDKGIWPDAE